MSSAKGSVYLALRSGPASTGSKPTSRISSAAVFLLFGSSPQYTRLGLVDLRRDSKTSNSTSLGTVPKADTTRAFGTFFTSSSAPEEVWATTRSVSSAFIGSEQLTMTLTLAVTGHTDRLRRVDRPGARAIGYRGFLTVGYRGFLTVHFRDFALSSSNQFSTTISLSGALVRIIKKRRSPGATAYCGPNRRDVNPAAGKSAAERPSENLG